MATSCPVGLDVKKLRDEVSFIYARVAEDPSGDFHFHRGAAYAAEFLGYDKAELDALPKESTDSFAGVANPHAIARLQPGERVVDIGCGAGMDLMLAAKRVGPGGRATGVDMTPAMAEKTRRSAEKAGLTNLEVRLGDALALPLEDASIDVVISNGVINLVPDKEKAYAEIFRVLKPGGRLQLGDIIVASELSEGIRSDIDLWTG
jgi:SAM-dependent methyltransferase